MIIDIAVFALLAMVAIGEMVVFGFIAAEMIGTIKRRNEPPELDLSLRISDTSISKENEIRHFKSRIRNVKRLASAMSQQYARCSRDAGKEITKRYFEVFDPFWSKWCDRIWHLETLLEENNYLMLSRSIKDYEEFLPMIAPCAQKITRAHAKLDEIQMLYSKYLDNLTKAGGSFQHLPLSKNTIDNILENICAAAFAWRMESFSECEKIIDETISEMALVADRMEPYFDEGNMLISSQGHSVVVPSRLVVSSQQDDAKFSDLFQKLDGLAAP